MLGEHGVAALVAVIVLVSVGAGTAVPVVVDTIDVNPDSPLYGLERAGERIREAFAGGQQMDITLARERMAEFELMVRHRKTAEYAWLADEIADRLEKAAGGCRDNAGLERAMQAVQTHLQRLENLLENENLPERARLALSLAICRSSAVMGVLSEVQAGEIPAAAIKENIREIREEIRALKRSAEENLKLGLPVEPALVRANVRVAERLMARIGRVIAVMPENAENLAEVVQKRLEDALANCLDNQTLQEVVSKLSEYLEKLENISENLPENIPWLPVLSDRIVVVAVVVLPVPQERLENIRERLENIRERIREIRREVREIKEEIRERLQRGENILPENMLGHIENQARWIENIHMQWKPPMPLPPENLLENAPKILPLWPKGPAHK